MENEEIFTTARLLIEDFAHKIELPNPNRMDVYLNRREDLVPAAAGLRVKRLGYLSCITGLDPGSDSESFEVLQHFCPAGVSINLRVDVPKNDAAIPSLCTIIPSAELFERELREMFGINVTGLRNPALLYLPDDWEEGVYPMKKDFDPQQIIHPN